MCCSIFKVFENIKITISDFENDKTAISKNLVHSQYLTEKQVKLRNEAQFALLKHDGKLKDIALWRTQKFSHGNYHKNFRGSDFIGVTSNGK